MSDHMGIQGLGIGKSSSDSCWIHYIHKYYWEQHGSTFSPPHVTKSLLSQKTLLQSKSNFWLKMTCKKLINCNKTNKSIIEQCQCCIIDLFTWHRTSMKNISHILYVYHKLETLGYINCHNIWVPHSLMEKKSTDSISIYLRNDLHFEKNDSQ